MKLQPWFASWWVLWSLALFVGDALILADASPGYWWHAGHLAVFVPPELWAYKRWGGGLADTLSELWHFVGSWAPDGVSWWKSWNAFVTLAAAATAFEAAYVFSGGLRYQIPAGIVGGLTFMWLLYHWLRPEKYG